MAVNDITAGDRAQQRRLRRSALLWALVAAAFYLGFIVLTVVRSTK
jgi:hypothetical protein